MSEAVAFYQDLAEKQRSACKEVAELQAKGVAYLVNKGFPTRADEAWRYSSPVAFLKEKFQSATLKAASARHDEIFISQSEVSHRIDIENGVMHEGTGESLPDGVNMMSLAQAFQTMPAVMARHRAKLFPIEHGFHALNAAMLDLSMVLHVAAHTQVAVPMSVLHYQDQAHQAVHARFIVLLEEGASLTMIEEFAGLEDCIYLSTRIMEVCLEKDAKMTHVLIQRESHKAHHASHLFVFQAAMSAFHSHVLNLGGQWVRTDQSYYLQGEAAHCVMNGVYGLRDAQHMAHYTAVFHEVAGCESQQDYKGIVAGRSQAVFNGRVVVRRHAQKTKALQQNKNLLLSTDAEVDTKPQLEIEANDVMCSHGATVGQLDEEALFYFASRGIVRSEAIRLMVDGFSVENITRFGPQQRCERLSAVLREHLVGERS
ncbi:MAG: Fe-S cluster assembly protein SufD [Gammaproteobacteria bacterium]|nr:Fe-S cluster assembly protein SufD [Gammaproteobacteria bacterium]